LIVVPVVTAAVPVLVGIPALATVLVVLQKAPVEVAVLAPVEDHVAVAGVTPDVLDFGDAEGGTADRAVVDPAGQADVVALADAAAVAHDRDHAARVLTDELAAVLLVDERAVENESPVAPA